MDYYEYDPEIIERSTDFFYSFSNANNNTSYYFSYDLTMGIKNAQGQIINPITVVSAEGGGDSNGDGSVDPVVVTYTRDNGQLGQLVDNDYFIRTGDARLRAFDFLKHAPDAVVVLNSIVELLKAPPPNEDLVKDEGLIIKDGYWESPVTDKKGQYMGYVRSGDWGYEFYDKNGALVDNEYYPSTYNNWNTISGLQYQEDRSHNDWAVDLHVAMLAQKMLVTPLLASYDEVSSKLIAMGLRPLAALSTNPEKAVAEARAKEAAYEIRLKQMLSGWVPTT
ncbi:hypothetical protein C1707_21315 [Caulobacter flavus]|uniref:Uncharacterized protein n=2 Tax=Caulobacter flavus TaxID=1679497 RepID=A0ABM7A2H1_9CAUL|nr:hypothetical protein C1707_21315 [Caulobacter flavus]